MYRNVDPAFYKRGELNPKEVLACLGKLHGDPDAVRLARTALEAYRLLHSANHEIAYIFRTIVVARADQLKASLNEFLRSLMAELLPDEENKNQNTSICNTNKIPDNVKTFLTDILASCRDLLIRDIQKNLSNLAANHRHRATLAEKIFLDSDGEKIESKQRLHHMGEVLTKLTNSAIESVQELSGDIQNLAIIGRLLVLLDPTRSVDFSDSVLQTFEKNPLTSSQVRIFNTESEESQSENENNDRIFASFSHATDSYLTQLTMFHPAEPGNHGLSDTVLRLKKLVVSAVQDLKETLLRIKALPVSSQQTPKPELTIRADYPMPIHVAQILVATLRAPGERRIRNFQPVSRHLILGHDGETREIIRHEHKAHENKPVIVGHDIIESLSPRSAWNEQVVATLDLLTEKEVFDLFLALIKKHVFKNPKGVDGYGKQLVVKENGIEYTVSILPGENGLEIEISSSIASGAFHFHRIGEAWALKRHEVEIKTPALSLCVSDSHIISDQQRLKIRQGLHEVKKVIPIEIHNGLKVFEAPNYIILDNTSYLELVLVDQNDSGQSVYGYQFRSTEDVKIRTQGSKPVLSRKARSTDESVSFISGALDNEAVQFVDLPEDMPDLVRIALANTTRVICTNFSAGSDRSPEIYTKLNTPRLFEDFRKQRLSEAAFTELVAVTPSNLVLNSDAFAEHPVPVLKDFISWLVQQAEDLMFRGAYYQTTPVGKGSAKTVVLSVVELNSKHYVVRYFPKFSRDAQYLVLPASLIGELEKQFVAWLAVNQSRANSYHADLQFRVDFHEWRKVFGERFTLEFLKNIPKEVELEELWISGVREVHFEFKGESFTVRLRRARRQPIKQTRKTRVREVVKAFLNSDDWLKLVRLYRLWNAK